MIALLERLLPLWTQPADAWDDTEAAFGEVYANPVVVNGIEMSITELVGRARSLQQAFDRLEMHILDALRRPFDGFHASGQGYRHDQPHLAHFIRRHQRLRAIGLLVAGSGLR